MKINIITILDNVNCGTYLQAYALANYLERNGHVVEYTNYIRPSRSWWNMYMSLLKTHKTPIAPFSKIVFLWRWCRCRKKQKEYIKLYLTKKIYHSYKDLLNDPPRADVYITGSDQVWNSWHNNGLDRSFFLGYAPNEAKKISYASSIGMDEFPIAEREDIKDLLNQYAAISVREMPAKQLLIKIGVPSEKIQFVADPTFLLSKKEWGESVSNRLYSCPYVLIYSVENGLNESILRVAKYVAFKKDLKIVSISNTTSKMPGCDFYHNRVDPSLFVSLFYHADFCVVSSFHGTAFSVNFHKDFVTVQPNRFNGRIDSLLSLCGLEGRKYTGTEDIKIFLEQIKYERVSSVIEKLRNQSMDFLKENL